MPAVVVFLALCVPVFALWYLAFDWAWAALCRFLERRLWRSLGGEGDPPDTQEER